MPDSHDPTVVLRAVSPAEPDGHPDGRRRSWGNGFGMPAVLVAASVVVVLLVIAMARMMPTDANAQIPLAGASAGASAGPSDQTPLLAPPPLDPSASVSASPSSSSPSPSAKPSRSVTGAPVPAPVRSTTRASASAPAARTPVAIEAESGSIGGAATSAACATCSGGATVRNIGANDGYVTLTVAGVSAAGTYPVTITYELAAGSRTFYLSVNGGAAIQVPLSSTAADANTPLTATVRVALSAGTNTIKFSNPTADLAPDLDRIAV